jgi:hypothetical protein
MHSYLACVAFGAALRQVYGYGQSTIGDVS